MGRFWEERLRSWDDFRDDFGRFGWRFAVRAALHTVAHIAHVGLHSSFVSPILVAIWGTRRAEKCDWNVRGQVRGPAGGRRYVWQTRPHVAPGAPRQVPAFDGDKVRDRQSGSIDVLALDSK